MTLIDASIGTFDQLMRDFSFSDLEGDTKNAILQGVINDFGASVSFLAKELVKLSVLVNLGEFSRGKAQRFSDYKYQVLGRLLKTKVSSSASSKDAETLSSFKSMIGIYTKRLERFNNLEKTNSTVAELKSAQARADLVSSNPSFEVTQNNTVALIGAPPSAQTPSDKLRQAVRDLQGVTASEILTAVKTVEENKVRFVARSNKLAKLATDMAAQANNARGPRGATPVAPPTPPKNTPKKPLPKPKGRR